MMAKKGNGNTHRIVDKEWAKIFDKYSIIEEVEKKGFFKITSTEINEFKEARLMTKFDHRSSLPNLFYVNDLSILPITRGEYVIGKFNAYQKLDLDYNSIKVREMEFPEWIQSINPKNLYSEASVLKCAYVTGMIKDVMEEEIIVPAVSGRMSTSSFDFKINHSLKKDIQMDIGIENSQCEIDAGYESLNQLTLIEAKNSFSDDFLIRQMYYPYRLWSKKINKPITPIFMIYSNDIFSFFIYRFKNPLYYNSLELIKEKHYTIKDKDITLNDIEEIMKNVKMKDEPKYPFPQADKFNRILDLIKSLYENPLSIENITLMYDFNQRQAQYYSRAGMYLGLIESKDKGIVKLSKLGEKIISKRKRERNLSLVRCILEHKIFYEVLKLYLEKCCPPSKEEIIDIMVENKDKIYNVNSLSTIERRAQTVFKWIEWILDLQS